MVSQVLAGLVTMVLGKSEIPQFSTALESLTSGNLLSTGVVVYCGLISAAVLVGGLRKEIASAAQNVVHQGSIGPGSGFRVTSTIVDTSRRHAYDNVVTPNGGVDGMLHTALWLSVLSFFGSPPGALCLYIILFFCTGLQSPESIADLPPLKTFLLATLITGCGSVATFLPFARMWDHLYDQNPELRCQQDKSHVVKGWNRLEVRLAVGNLYIAAAMTSAVALIHVHRPGTDVIYSDSPFASVGAALYFVVSAILFFLWIDAWAYVYHRALHFPFLYKHIHKVHHTWKQTTAFTSLALHPIEFIFMQGGVYVGFYVIPLHPAAIIANLLYIHYHNVVDHSGVYCESSLPWQPSTLYHDDHHRLFHVNYGQILVCWDKWGGTFWENKRQYTEKSFSH